uniref:Uncharacterized protein n=1 Tax=Timema bartmani TaxID=61472 RepID=A0A7R9F1I8_9NEOP|nr:unnamed protein product [Timema bartmani]
MRVFAHRPQSINKLKARIREEIEAIFIETLQRVTTNLRAYKPQQLRTLISDAGIYSYAAICALSLHELFDNPWDKDFNQRCIKLLLEHLKLPKQVEAVMVSLIEGQGSQSPDAYVQLLLSEAALVGKALLVIEDLIVFAVHGGMGTLLTVCQC